MSDVFTFHSSHASPCDAQIPAISKLTQTAYRQHTEIHMQYMFRGCRPRWQRYLATRPYVGVINDQCGISWAVNLSFHLESLLSVWQIRNCTGPSTTTFNLSIACFITTCSDSWITHAWISTTTSVWIARPFSRSGLCFVSIVGCEQRRRISPTVFTFTFNFSLTLWIFWTFFQVLFQVLFQFVLEWHVKLCFGQGTADNKHTYHRWSQHGIVLLLCLISLPYCMLLSFYCHTTCSMWWVVSAHLGSSRLLQVLRVPIA